MVNLNKSTRYALHAALEMAVAGDRPVTVGEIAERYEIPENVLAKALQQLTRAGIARGVRGVGGGYRLARAPEDVALQDIIDIFEPTLPPDVCMLRVSPGGKCPGSRRPRCRLMKLFQGVAESARSKFESVSLATLVAS
jgi:Rrf2 family iron-sulfur cluster assembly transcriptional regulator